MEQTTTNEAVILALVSAAIKDETIKTAKGTIPDNSKFEGSVTVEIPFTLNKGEEHEVKPTVNLLSLETWAKAAVYCGITSEALENALIKAATGALEKGNKVGDALAAGDARVADMITRIKTNVINALPLQKRNGTVTVKVLTANKQPKVLKSDIKQIA